jgi:integrase/recombinase XerC
LTFSSLLPLFINYLRIEKKYSPHTCTAYENDLHGFVQFCKIDFETEALLDIRHTHIRSWIVTLMSNEITPISVNRKISALRTFYKWTLKKGHTNVNPMIKIIAPKKAKRLPVIVQDANITRLLEHNITLAGDNPYTEARDAFIIELLYSTGIRRAELVGLKISDFNIDRQEIRVVGKGNKVRSIPLTDELILAFEAYKKARTDVNIDKIDILFLTEKGKAIYPRLVHTIVSRKLSSITTLTKKSPHVLRHSFATHMLDRGADINAIKEILGHANLGATQVYTHNSITKLKDAYKKAHPRSINNE